MSDPRAEGARPAIQHGDSTWTHASFASGRSQLPGQPVDPLAPGAANLSRMDNARRGQSFRTMSTRRTSYRTAATSEETEHAEHAAPSAAPDSGGAHSRSSITLAGSEHGPPQGGNKDGEGKPEEMSEKSRDTPYKKTKDEHGEEYYQVTWAGPDDPDNPQNWPAWRKWTGTLLATLLTLNATYASSAPSAATEDLARDYHIGMTTANLITSLFLFGYCLGPLIWSTLSEIYGRRNLFIVSGVLYTVFIIPQPLAPNAPCLFITRFISGTAAACPLSNAGGLIADVWSPYMRGVAMSCFSVAVFIGPAIGPITASFIVENAYWQLVFWVMLAFAGACVLLIILFLPETFAPVLLARKAKRLRKEDPEKYKDHYAASERVKHTPAGIVEKDLVLPFKILALEPILVLVTVYLSVVYGILYCCFESFPLIWQGHRGLSSGLGSLMFCGILIGTTLGGLISYMFNRRYKALQVLWGASVPPEERLWGAILAGPLLTISLFWLGWTGEYAAVPWYVPELATIPLGMSFTLVFISFLSFIVDAYMHHAASALAANVVIRSAVGAAFPLFTTQMFLKLGINWADSLLGFIALVLTPSPILFYIYGKKIRHWSRFAPAPDLKRRAELEKEGLLPEGSEDVKFGSGNHGLKAAKRMLAEQQQEQASAA